MRNGGSRDDEGTQPGQQLHILNVNNDLQDLIVLHPRAWEAKTIGPTLTNESRVPSLYPVLQYDNDIVHVDITCCNKHM